MVFGKYTVTVVYGTKSFCDPRVLLSLDRMRDLEQVMLDLEEHG